MTKKHTDTRISFYPRDPDEVVSEALKTQLPEQPKDARIELLAEKNYTDGDKMHSFHRATVDGKSATVEIIQDSSDGRNYYRFPDDESGRLLPYATPEHAINAAIKELRSAT